MLESLRIKNFQAHESFTLKFSPRVTTLIGKSDVGKSAVVRALRWLCLNRPNGDAFIRDGAKETKVVLKVDEHKIIRKRGRENLYSIGSKKFKAFGNDVPAEITKVLNVTEQNFQGQHDPAFWFTSPAPEVSRQLNAIINLGIIDRTLGNLNRELRAAGVRVEITQERLGEAKTACKAHANTPKIVAALAVCDNLNTRAAELGIKAVLLGETVKAVAEQGEMAKNAGNKAKRGVAVAELGAKWEQIALVGEGLRNLLVAGRSAERRRASLRVPNVTPLEGLCSSWQITTESRRNLAQLVQSARNAGSDQSRWDKNAKEAEKEFKTKAGKVCPLCLCPIR